MAASGTFRFGAVVFFSFAICIMGLPSFPMECKSPEVEAIKLTEPPPMPSFLEEGEILDNVSLEFYAYMTQPIATEAHKCELEKSTHVSPD